MRPSIKVKTQLLVKIFLATSLVLAVLGLSAVQTTSAQTPRPTLTPAPTETPTPTPTATAEPTPAPEVETQTYTYTGPLLRGRVINVATGQPEGAVPVRFVVDGIAVETVSDKDGKYAFEHLGTANGLLNVAPPQGGGLRPMTSDIAVQTRGGVETVVNLGVTTNGVGTPPLVPTVEVAPGSVGAGELMTITVFAKNTLPNAITGAMVTNWLPARLTPVNIKSNTGNPYFSGNLAIVELGTLDPDDGALIEIVAQASGGRTTTTALQGKVSFFYREDVAAQATAGFSNATPTVLPVTGVGLPVAGLVLLAVVVIIGWLRRHISNASSPV